MFDKIQSKFLTLCYRKSFSGR